LIISYLHALLTLVRFCYLRFVIPVDAVKVDINVDAAAVIVVDVHVVEVGFYVNAAVV